MLAVPLSPPSSGSALEALSRCSAVSIAEARSAMPRLHPEKPNCADEYTASVAHLLQRGSRNRIAPVTAIKQGYVMHPISIHIVEVENMRFYGSA
jgi:hypothetical protein